MDKNARTTKYVPEIREQPQTQITVAPEVAKQESKRANAKQTSTHVWTPAQNFKNQCQHTPAVSVKPVAEQKRTQQKIQHGGSGF